MNPDVDKFIKKTKQWQHEIETLRNIILETKLEESIKWGKPCYTYHDCNVAIIQPFKACLGMMFFKGALLKDPKNRLVDNGPNSQAARRFEFISVQEITKLKSTIKAYIQEAIEIERSGKKVEFKQNPELIPEELEAIFAKNKKFKKAFEELTPGRQRAYILHFSSAKQASTRQSRIEKCIPLILSGKGIHDQ